MLFSEDNILINPEQDPLFYLLPQTAMELLIDHPILQDLLKSEAYIWEKSYFD
tara:strand:+ start:562 stop:720 length:159 start_codon:yes stop_codon:yes gene_type:complete